jgi:hypothetical protein
MLKNHRVAISLLVSLLAHSLLFYSAFRQPVKPVNEASQPMGEPLSVRLMDAAPAPRPAPAPAPAAQVAAVPKKPEKPRRAAPRRPVIASSRPDAEKPITPAQPAPPAPPIAQADAAPPMDMMAMLNAARERRRNAEQTSRSSAPPAEPAEATGKNDIAIANIQHSLQAQSKSRDDASGVFKITYKGVRTSQFLFRGWKQGSQRPISQSIEVEAGPDGNIELATVRRIIALIRTYHTGDFNWDSHRLGRVVVLSARAGDNAELEAFLMQEFFGA